MNAVVAVVSVLVSKSVVAVDITVKAAATVSKPVSIFVALVNFTAAAVVASVVASATCIVLAVSAELDFSDKTLMKLVN